MDYQTDKVIKFSNNRLSRFLNKIFGLFKYRKELISFYNGLIHNKEQQNILNGYGISSLPSVSVEDFFVFLKDNNCNLTITTDFSTGISPVNDYYLLCRTARAIGVKKYFEIGTWLGLSAKNIADTLGDDIIIYSLDIPFNHPEIAIYNIPVEIFGHYCKSYKNISLLKSDSKYFDFSPYKKTLDLVFVDGNHSPDYVESDSVNALSLLKNDDSIIAWHDYMILGVVNNDVLSGILRAIPQKDHRHLIHIKHSNLALYSKSFNFPFKETPVWEISDNNFTLDFKIK